MNVDPALREAMRIMRHVATHGVVQCGEQWPNAECCLDAGRALGRRKGEFQAAAFPDVAAVADALEDVWVRPDINAQERFRSWTWRSEALAAAYAEVAPPLKPHEPGEVRLPRSKPKPTEADLLRAAECPDVFEGKVDTSLFADAGWTAKLESYGGGGVGLVTWTHTSGARVIAAGPGSAVIEPVDADGTVAGSLNRRLCILDALRIAAPGSV